MSDSWSESNWNIDQMTRRSVSFEQHYFCYSVTSINRPQLENGDKIIMPASALHRLASLEIEYPMLFEIRTEDNVTHCGVLEFVADEGMIYMPEWMMENMGLDDGSVVKVKNVRLPKGKFIKLQPHSVDFLDVTNPKAVLERTLRGFTCLTVGDTFMVWYNNKKYCINVLETRPGNAVSVVETDCEVDFAPSLDYKEPEPEPKAEEVVEAVVEAQVELKSFTGNARRLDGKVVEVPVLSSASSEKKAGTSSGSGGGASRRQANGKLVFGGKKDNGKDVAKESVKPDTEKKEAPKFQPFTGKKYSLI